jgi:S-methylmethionine-dependent homocysteine/selenocysteine methylase
VTIILLDGAMGTELKARGAAVPDYQSSIWSAMALVRDPEQVRRLHCDYIRAGADVITANNYAVVPRLLGRESMAHRLEELTRTACRLAWEARDAAGRPGVRIAGSLPPLDTTYRPDLVRDDAELYTTYLRIARILVDEADMAIAETLTTVREAVAAARAAAEVGLPLWVSWNLQLDAPVLRGGETLAAAADAVAHLPVEGLMVNCLPTSLVRSAIEQLRAATDRPLGAYANSCESASSQEALDGCTVSRMSPEEYAAASEPWVAAGATFIGGCCDTDPGYIAALARRHTRQVVGDDPLDDGHRPGA